MSVYVKDKHGESKGKPYSEIPIEEIPLEEGEYFSLIERASTLEHHNPVTLKYGASTAEIDFCIDPLTKGIGGLHVAMVTLKAYSIADLNYLRAEARKLLGDEPIDLTEAESTPSTLEALQRVEKIVCETATAYIGATATALWNTASSLVENQEEVLLDELKGLTIFNMIRRLGNIVGAIRELDTDMGTAMSSFDITVPNGFSPSEVTDKLIAVINANSNHSTTAEPVDETAPFKDITELTVLTNHLHRIAVVNSGSFTDGGRAEIRHTIVKLHELITQPVEETVPIDDSQGDYSRHWTDDEEAVEIVAEMRQSAATTTSHGPDSPSASEEEPPAKSASMIITDPASNASYGLAGSCEPDMSGSGKTEAERIAEESGSLETFGELPETEPQVDARPAPAVAPGLRETERDALTANGFKDEAMERFDAEQRQANVSAQRRASRPTSLENGEEDLSYREGRDG